ncbi:hypothetical protein OMK64_01690 [Cellulomonas fimi]|uniref:hypothetical protein n=1 Tax=Cellulomonas fimi TaxID=1708 RepID=UPI00234C6183|nr:hypothetical protein [Cellulomonas fimi]MDC7120244.1 hypothetical protein [Cellulomonas fimi]
MNLRWDITTEGAVEYERLIRSLAARRPDLHDALLDDVRDRLERDDEDEDDAAFEARARHCLACLDCMSTLD